MPEAVWLQAASELASERAGVRAQRMELEQERARVLAMRDEAAESSAANAEKDACIERLQAVKADVEARATAHASEARLLQSQSSRLLQEFEALHADVFGCTVSLCAVTAAPGPYDSSVVALQRAGGGVAVDGEGLVRLRRRVQEALRAHAVGEERRRGLQEELDKVRQELSGAKSAAAAAQAEVGALWQSVRDAQELLLEAREGRERALSQAEDCRHTLKHAEGELREAESAAAAARCARDRALAACVGQENGRLASPLRDAAAAWPEAPALTSVPSQVHVGSSVSSSAVIAQRLEQLEAEEGELQAEMVEFREKVARQQAQLQQSVRSGVRPAPQEARLQYVGLPGVSVGGSPLRHAGVCGPVSPILGHSGYAYNPTMCPPASVGLKGYAEGRRANGPFGADPGQVHAAAWAVPAATSASLHDGVFPESINRARQRSQSMRTTVEDITHEHRPWAPAGAKDVLQQSTSSEEVAVVSPRLCDSASMACVSDRASVLAGEPAAAARAEADDKGRGTSQAGGLSRSGGAESCSVDASRGLGDDSILATQASSLQVQLGAGASKPHSLHVPSGRSPGDETRERRDSPAHSAVACEKAASDCYSSCSSSCVEQHACVHAPSLTSRILGSAPQDCDGEEPYISSDKRCTDSVALEMPQERSWHRSMEDSNALSTGVSDHGSQFTPEASTDARDEAMQNAAGACEQAPGPDHPLEQCLDRCLDDGRFPHVRDTNVTKQDTCQSDMPAMPGALSTDGQIRENDDGHAAVPDNTSADVAGVPYLKPGVAVEDHQQETRSSEIEKAPDVQDCSSASMVCFSSRTGRDASTHVLKQ